MRVRMVLSCVLMAMLMCPRAAFAAQSQSQHVVDLATLKQAVAAKASIDRANRRAVLKVLDRSDVRTVAAKMGLDVKRAQSAVTSLEGAQLADLAKLAHDSERDLAGGSRTVTLSVTTLLLLLILIVLIAN